MLLLIETMDGDSDTVTGLSNVTDVIEMTCDQDLLYTGTGTSTTRHTY